jgi:hypothetical protein
MNPLKHTNGIGHLVMSIFMTLVGLALLIVPGLDSGAHGVGIGLILAVQAAWFVSGSANQIAKEVVRQAQLPQQPVQAPPPSTAPLVQINNPPLPPTGG